MAKFLIFTDIHIHPHKNSLQRLQHCLDALEWVFSTAIERGITNVIFLGDLFQDRQKIQILPYHRTYECFQKYAAKGLKIHMLVGNHDMWYADRCDISSVFPFGAIEGVNIISEPSTVEIAGYAFDFLPYTSNILESLKFFEKPSPVLFGHVSIDGAKLNFHYKRIAEISVEFEGDMISVSAERFSKWRKVFLGHFHGAQQLENVEYVGSPLQLNFAEAFQEKHILIFDADTHDVEYVVNNKSPKHFIVTSDELEKFDLNNSFVRFEPKDVTSSDLVDVIRDLKENRKAIHVEVGDSRDALVEQKEIEDAKSIVLAKDKFVMLARYVDAVECGSLGKDELLGIGKMLVEKSQVQ